ncbi:MAG: carbohydrate kinase family protein [Acutalibacteraceae bacterium]|nr:carbohydrate kinase family protein [Acutalibacteraceae bacterium]
MQKEILVSGLLNVETNVAVKGFPIPYYPIDYPFFGVTSNVSGVGCNIAKALTALGDKVTLLSFLGQDEEAQRILRDLQKDGIGTENITAALKNTPVSVVLHDSDGRRQVYCDLKDIQEQRLIPSQYSNILSRTDIAVLCNINFNRDLIKAAHAAGVLTATDVHVLHDIHDEYNRDFMENADILFLSDERLPCEPEQFIRNLYACYHNKIIVIGMGAKGALLLEGADDHIVMVPAYHTETIVNTVGAGDALFSAFLHFYLKGYDPTAALQYAVIFAGIKIGFNGAALGFSSEKEIESAAAGHSSV